MILPILIVVLIGYAIAQCRESRAPIWRARAAAVRENPFRKNVVADIRATYRYASTWRVRVRDRREMKRLLPPDFID